MTRYLCDTSALVAMVCSWHEHHARTLAETERRARAGEELVLAAHSLAETYAVLTRLPAPNRLRSGDAIALLEANWRETPVVHLTAAETWRMLGRAQRRGVIGGQTYDMLIAACALKADASTIITWNVRHFAAAAHDIRVKAPP
jgi:predicted nucleic acid-binding protein